MSTSMLTIRIRVQDAADALKGPGLQRLLAATRAALSEKERRDSAPSKLPMRPRLPTQRRPDGSWSTKKLRLAVWERSEGYCENPACGRRIRWETFDLDHYVGRARAPQSPENTWALCWALSADESERGLVGCHRLKHAGKPSRLHWHRVFLLHLEQHGFGRSETAKAIRDELAAKEQLQEAQRHAALAVSSAENMAERARRAEGAADA